MAAKAPWTNRHALPVGQHYFDLIWELVGIKWPDYGTAACTLELHLDSKWSRRHSYRHDAIVEVALTSGLLHIITRTINWHRLGPDLRDWIACSIDDAQRNRR